MKGIHRFCALIFAMVLAGLAFGQPSFPFQGGSATGTPVSPSQVQESRTIALVVREAESLAKQGQTDAALAKFRIAVALEDARGDRGSEGPRLLMAEFFAKLGRMEDAAQAYQQAFRWDDNLKKVVMRGGLSLRDELGYAIVLGQLGREQDAKAMYYAALLNLNSSKNRSMEPMPFLVVFDPEPGAVVWSFSPTRLEAAARMALAIHGYDREHKRVVELAPDWFYPVVWRFRASTEPKALRELGRASTLAQGPIEVQLLADYRMALNELKAMREASSEAVPADPRPMVDGFDRRQRMQCLIPNPEILKRLSTPIPN